MIAGILAVVFLAIVGWFGVGFVVDYAAAKGSVWQRSLAASSQSATMLWSKGVAVGSAIVGFLIEVANATGDTSLGDSIKAVLKPEYIPWYVLAISALGALARLRTLGKS